ncbi:MAG TPA: prepilin peptidase [Caulobacteraceae bacterium]
MSPDLLRTALLCVFSLLVVFAGVRDIVSYTIPNWVSGALAAAFVPAALICGVPLLPLLEAAGLGAAMLVAGMVMFALKWMGGGDAKLLAAASLWVGLPGLAPFLLYTGLAGGLLALSLLALRSAWVRPLVVAGPGWLGRLATPGAATPYGVAIAAGALAAFPQSLLTIGPHAAF